MNVAQMKNVDKSKKKRTKRQRKDMSLIQQVTPGAVAGRQTPCHLPPCLMHMTFQRVLIDRRAVAVYQCLMKAESQP